MLQMISIFSSFAAPTRTTLSVAQIGASMLIQRELIFTFITTCKHESVVIKLMNSLIHKRNSKRVEYAQAMRKLMKSSKSSIHEKETKLLRFTSGETDTGSDAMSRILLICTPTKRSFVISCGVKCGVVEWEK